MKSELRIYKAADSNDSEKGYNISLEGVYEIDDLGIATYSNRNKEINPEETSIVLIGRIPADEAMDFNSSIHKGGLPTKEIKKEGSTELQNIVDYCHSRITTKIEDGDYLIIRITPKNS